MKTKNITLTHEQASLILQALLFSASSDICADWDDEDTVKMIEAARHIMAECYSSKEKPDLKKIHLYGGLPYEQDFSETLPKEFGLKVKKA